MLCSLPAQLGSRLDPKKQIGSMKFLELFRLRFLYFASLVTIFVHTNLSFFMCLSGTIFFSFLSLYALFYCHIVVISRIPGALWEPWEVYKISSSE